MAGACFFHLVSVTTDETIAPWSWFGDTIQSCPAELLPSKIWLEWKVMGSGLVELKISQDSWLQLLFFLKIHSLKLTWPLKMDGWNTIVSFWDGLFSGAMLVSGRVEPQDQPWSFYVISWNDVFGEMFLSNWTHLRRIIMVRTCGSICSCCRDVSTSNKAQAPFLLKRGWDSAFDERMINQLY